jgi:G3E family GTPase
VLHLPQEGTHRYRLLKHKEQEERQNEETPAGKVRHESAARGKLHGEVSSPATTQDETKTEEARNPLPQTTLRPVFRSKGFNDSMMNREYFLKYSQAYGPFDLDRASDNDGLNSQVAEDFH